MKGLSLSAVLLLTFWGAYGQHHEDTVRKQLLGAWRITTIASDDNRNGRIDSEEIFTIPPGPEVELFITFNEDGSGNVKRDIFHSEPDLIEWDLINDTKIKIKPKAEGKTSRQLYQLSVLGNGLINIDSISGNSLTMSGLIDQHLIVITAEKQS